MKQPPEEKAKELLSNFSVISRSVAIKLASMCVDEVIKANPSKLELSGKYYDRLLNTDYWQQVKQELQKM